MKKKTHLVSQSLQFPFAITHRAIDCILKRGDDRVTGRAALYNNKMGIWRLRRHSVWNTPLEECAPDCLPKIFHDLQPPAINEHMFYHNLNISAQLK